MIKEVIVGQEAKAAVDRGRELLDGYVQFRSDEKPPLPEFSVRVPGDGQGPGQVIAAKADDDGQLIMNIRVSPVTPFLKDCAMMRSPARMKQVDDKPCCETARCDRQAMRLNAEAERQREICLVGVEGEALPSPSPASDYAQH